MLGMPDNEPGSPSPGNDATTVVTDADAAATTADATSSGRRASIPV
jgi:hypothetical protein